MSGINEQSDEVASGKGVIWVDGVLEALEDVDAGVSHASGHEFLSELAHAVVVGDAASVFQDLVPRGIFNLAIYAHWIGQTLVDEAEIDVHTCSSVVDLYKITITWVTLEEMKGYFLMPCFLHSVMMRLLTAEHILETSFQGREVSKDSAIKLYLKPKSLRQPIMKVRKQPLSPFSPPALNPLCFFAIAQMTFCWFYTYCAFPSKRIVQRVILLGSNPITSVMKYFLAEFMTSCNLLLSSIFKAMPNWNCLLSISLKLAGQTFDCATSYMNLIPTSKSQKRIDSYTFFSGIGRIFTMHSVIMPKFPS